MARAENILDRAQQGTFRDDDREFLQRLQQTPEFRELIAAYNNLWIEKHIQDTENISSIDEAVAAARKLGMSAAEINASRQRWQNLLDARRPQAPQPPAPAPQPPAPAPASSPPPDYSDFSDADNDMDSDAPFEREPNREDCEQYKWQRNPTIDAPAPDVQEAAYLQNNVANNTVGVLEALREPLGTTNLVAVVRAFNRALRKITGMAVVPQRAPIANDAGTAFDMSADGYVHQLAAWVGQNATRARVVLQAARIAGGAYDARPSTLVQETCWQRKAIPDYAFEAVRATSKEDYDAAVASIFERYLVEPPRVLDCNTVEVPTYSVAHLMQANAALLPDATVPPKRARAMQAAFDRMCRHHALARYAVVVHEAIRAAGQTMGANILTPAAFVGFVNEYVRVHGGAQ